MTPKEEAAKLFKKFYEKLPPQSATPFDVSEIAKQCAIICVEEMIQTMEPGYISPVNYWQKVKTEIEKL